MNTTIKQYEPLMKVTTKDDKELYFPASKYESMKKCLETQNFIEIEGVLMARWNVKTIEKSDKGLDYEIPKEYREIIKKRTNQFYDSTGRQPEIGVKMRWVEMLKNNENIF